jgi:hypothetical protein
MNHTQKLENFLNASAEEVYISSLHSATNNIEQALKLYKESPDKAEVSLFAAQAHITFARIYLDDIRNGVR